MTNTYGDCDIITYIAFGDVVRVDEREADVKGGRPGFVGRVVAGPELNTPAWGYDDQIEGVFEDVESALRSL